ncbi:hypothetical protein Dfri01_27340 [Dyadobacter frigoris]|nr:hypothetical protein Dfri01_27340 [Dyadobacter frigoris]
MLGMQMRRRNNFKLDISMFITLAENTFFNPTYYHTFIEQYKDKREILIRQSQGENVYWDGENQIRESFITSNFMNNPLGVNFFGY